MARGGKRLGSGRPKGARERPKPIIVRDPGFEPVLIHESATPLEVMLAAMRAALAEGRLELAARHAEKAAPYVHPRIGSTDAKTINGKAQSPRQMDRDELQHIAASGRA